MIRKLSLAVAVATALSPLGVFALGLGDITTQSALNQRFRAEIDLHSVTRDELQDIRVGLASNEAFIKAGIDRPYLLSALRFTPSLAPDGRMIIAVNSADPVREPFLNFLLEVNWPKGRMLREYTVLLDPPVTLARKPAPIATPKVAAAPSRQLAPVRKTNSAIVAGSYPASSSQTGGAREYGPIQSNDNLWQIAQSLRLQGETVEQVMMALQQHNPNAFIRNNVNGLKAGKILRLPEDADVTGMSHRDARREFLAQTREWREQRSKPAVESAVTKSVAEQAESVKTIAEKDRLELISAKPDAADDTQAAEGKAQSTEKISRLEQEVMLVREENESSRQENEALHTRIRELESQIGDIQRLLTLRSDQLTQLQTTQQVVEEKTEALEAAQDEATIAVEPEPPTADKSVPQAEASVEDSQVIEEVDIESIVAEAMKTDAAPAEVVVPKSELSQPTEMEQPAKPAVAEPVPVSPPVADTKPQIPPEPVPTAKPKQGGFLDILTGNSTLMGVIGAVVALLLSLLWLIMRRRKEAEAEFAESILVTPEGEAALAGNLQGAAGSVNEPSEETSFMSDFSPSDIDALQDETGEVDPVSEADVYIAYGRYQQAEELIKQAIERFPEREELKHKLLEIYYSAKNTKQFNRLAEELQQAGLEKEKPDTWARVASMGKELDPGNTMFAVAAGAATGGVLNALGEGLDDLDLNLNSDLLKSADAGSSDKDSGQELDLADEISEMDLGDLSDLSDLDEVDSESLESSLSLDSEFLNNLEADQQPDAGETKAGSGALDVDLDILDDARDSYGQTGEDNLDLSSTLDGLSELSGLDLSEPSENANVVGIEDSESLDDLDLESLEKELELLSEDLEDEVVEVPVADEMDVSEKIDTEDEVLDLDSTDEVTTKLDLARAYVDMGDEEGAKSILEEVVKEGSDDQKQQAQELLGSISS